jgi:hypothetical protein
MAAPSREQGHFQSKKPHQPHIPDCFKQELSIAMAVPAWLVPLMGLLGLLTIASVVEFIVTSALLALQKAGTIREDLLANSLVSEAAFFKCGLIELVRGKASVHGIEKQMHCKIVPQCTNGRRVQCIRAFVVILTFAMVFSGEYLVFFVTQKAIEIDRISSGVPVISFDGGTSAANLGPSGDCAIIDERSSAENSMTQYIYESCLLNFDSAPGSLQGVKKDLYLNFSEDKENNVMIAFESQGRLILNLILLDYVTTFESQRVPVGYKRNLNPIVEIFAKGFRCTPLRQNLVTCGDRTPGEVWQMYLAASQVLIKSARKRMANNILILLDDSLDEQARKLVSIDRSIIRYSFANEIGNARGISLIVLSGFGFLIWCYKMMTVSELAEMIRKYETVEGYSASTVYGMERQEKELKLHVDSLSWQGHLSREPINQDNGDLQDLGGREIVTGGRR